MKQLIEELERIEKESQAKLNDCISSYLKEQDYTKCNKYVESLRIFNNRYKDMHAINELVKVASNRIKLSLEYKKSEKIKKYDYASSFVWKSDNDFFQGGRLKGEIDAYKEIIKMLFGCDNDESAKE